MGADHQGLPLEITEQIIDFASDPYAGRSDPKAVLLKCALVCKAWLWPARRQLLSLYFPTGVIKTYSTPYKFQLFSDVFQSPLCTLDPAFYQVLEVHMGPLLPWGRGKIMFSGFLSTLSRIPFSSLHSLRFRDANLEFGEDRNAGNPSLESAALTLPPQVTKLVIEGTHLSSPAIEGVIRAAHLCPSLGSLAVHGAAKDLDHSEKLYSLRPPQSLREVDVDISTFLDVGEWLAGFEPRISSLSIRDYRGMDGHKEEDLIRRLPLVLGALGPKLEEFDLTFAGALYVESHKFTFAGDSLKRLVVRAQLHLLTSSLPHLSEIMLSAPHLENLLLHIKFWDENRFSLLVEFQQLDEFVQSHRTLRQITFLRELVMGDRGWREFQTKVREYMPGCAERGMIEFQNMPWGVQQK